MKDIMEGVIVSGDIASFDSWLIEHSGYKCGLESIRSIYLCHGLDRYEVQDIIDELEAEFTDWCDEHELVPGD